MPKSTNMLDGTYTRDELLGEGGFGVVHKAFSKARAFAVKFVADCVSSRDGLHLISEVRFLEELCNPHVVRSFGVASWRMVCDGGNSDIVRFRRGLCKFQDVPGNYVTLKKMRVYSEPSRSSEPCLTFKRDTEIEILETACERDILWGKTHDGWVEIGLVLDDGYCHPWLATKRNLSVQQCIEKWNPRYLGLVQELATEGTLATWLEAWDDLGPLGSEDVRRWSWQLLSALAHCHERRIVHADVKPRNLLMFRGGTLKLADFGISWRDTDEKELFVFSGTYRYMAPEVLFNHVMLRVRSSADVWSASCVIAEMVHGSPIFSSRSHASWPHLSKRRRQAADAMIQVLGVPSCTSFQVPGVYNSHTCKGLGLDDACPRIRLVMGLDILLMLQSCFSYDPTGRPTAEKALLHFQEQQIAGYRKGGG